MYAKGTKVKVRATLVADGEGGLTIGCHTFPEADVVTECFVRKIIDPEAKAVSREPYVSGDVIEMMSGTRPSGRMRRRRTDNGWVNSDGTRILNTQLGDHCYGVSKREEWQVADIIRNGKVVDP